MNVGQFIDKWEDTKIIAISDHSITIEDTWEQFNVSRAKVEMAVKLDKISEKIYARDGGIFGGCCFWTEDECEADRFQIELNRQGIEFEFSNESFFDGRGLKFVFEVEN